MCRRSSALDAHDSGRRRCRGFGRRGARDDALADLEARTGAARCSGPPRRAPCCPPRCCGGWRVTPAWSRTCSAPPGRTWTSAGWCACSPGLNGDGCGGGTGAAPTPGAPPRASWCRAHHVRHWADGGLSDIDNAALLCERHHTVVHHRRLRAQVREKPDELAGTSSGTWTHGSYDRHLERLRRRTAVHDPPPLTPERLRRLLDAVASKDPDEQRWADDACSSSRPTTNRRTRTCPTRPGPGSSGPA